MVEGWSEEHGLLCVACGEPIQENDYVAAVYKAQIGKGKIACFLKQENMVYVNRGDFLMFAHLKCNK